MPRHVPSLLAAGADPNAERNHRRMLEEAVLHEDPAMRAVTVQRLLDAGADVNPPTWYTRGRTVLMHACSQPDALACVTVLLEAGADLHAWCKTTYGIPHKNVLHHASAAGCPEVIALLLDRGLSADTPDRLGQTAIDMASQGHHVQALQVLMRASSADLTVKAEALDLAYRRCQQQADEDPSNASNQRLAFKAGRQREEFRAALLDLQLTPAPSLTGRRLRF